MSNSSSIGKAITENLRFISRVGAECNALMKMVREAVSTVLLEPALASRFRAEGNWINDYINDEHNWVTNEIASSLAMVIKPKRSIGGYLIVQISLTGPGINAEGNQEPLMHIGWWGSAIDFNATLMGFPLHIEPGYELALEGERLFRWTYPEFESEWCYSVRLTDINSPLDVHTHIVNPVKALLLGNDAGSALSDTAAIRYEIVINGQGEYRVLP